MSRRLTCGAVFVTAAGLRLGYLLYARPLFTTTYWDLAGNLLWHGQLGFLSGRTTSYEPLYPLFLTLARAICLDHVLLVQAAQALVASAGAVGLYLLAEALTKRRLVALLAAALFAVDPTLVRHAVSPSEFSLMATLLAAFTYTFVTIEGPRRAASAGVWLGLAVLTRTMALPLILLGAVVLTLGDRRRAAGMLAATALAVASPLAARNYTVNGALLPTRSGLNLFIGNSEYSAALIPTHSPDILQEYAVMIARGHGLAVSEFGIEDERGADLLFTRLAIEEAKKRPREITWLKVRNVAYFFWPWLIPERVLAGDTTVALSPGGGVRVDHSLARPLVDRIAYTASYGLVLAAAVLGVSVRRPAIRRDRILWCVLLTFVGAAVVYFPATRYRVPVEFVLLFYAAIGLESLPGRLSPRVAQVFRAAQPCAR